ncbi:MAG: OmpA family protein [Burkholderiales bacterium]|nr:MAG: OmpA family protein [Burkholderiales bacterium]
MTTTEMGGTPVQGAPRRLVEDAWVALNRRYLIGAVALSAALVLLWATGNGPGAWRAAAPGAAPVAASRDASGNGAAPSAQTQPGGATPAAAGSTGGAGAPASSASSPPAANGGAAGGTTATPAPAAPAPAANGKGNGNGNAAPPSGSGQANGAAAATPRALPGAPVARLYFEPDQAWPVGELGPRLAPVLARLKADPDTKALVSGFHDRRGSAERNATLANRRAQAVRRVLIREGVAADRIVLAKPQQTQGSGPDREARRVEVTVAR